MHCRIVTVLQWQFIGLKVIFDACGTNFNQSFLKGAYVSHVFSFDPYTTGSLFLIMEFCCSASRSGLSFISPLALDPRSNIEVFHGFMPRNIFLTLM